MTYSDANLLGWISWFHEITSYIWFQKQLAHSDISNQSFIYVALFMQKTPDKVIFIYCGKRGKYYTGLDYSLFIFIIWNGATIAGRHTAALSEQLHSHVAAVLGDKLLFLPWIPGHFVLWQTDGLSKHRATRWLLMSTLMRCAHPNKFIAKPKVESATSGRDFNLKARLSTWKLIKINFCLITTETDWVFLSAAAEATETNQRCAPPQCQLSIPLPSKMGCELLNELTWLNLTSPREWWKINK